MSKSTPKYQCIKIKFHNLHCYTMPWGYIT